MLYAETNTILKSNYLSIKNNNNNPPAPNTVIMVAGVVRAIIYEFGGLLIQSINTINNKLVIRHSQKRKKCRIYNLKSTLHDSLLPSLLF